MSRRAFAAVALVCALSAAACGGDGTSDDGEALPSGSLGVVTPEAARDAVLGLCDLAGAMDARRAEATFLDRSHATLHAIAAAAEVRDRPSAAALFEAKQQVEADIARSELPPRFRRDVETLVDATRRAVDAIGLAPPPPCEG